MPSFPSHILLLLLTSNRSIPPKDHALHPHLDSALPVSADEHNPLLHSDIQAEKNDCSLADGLVEAQVAAAEERNLAAG